MHEVLLFRGDGIGPEIVEAAVRVVNVAGVSVNWREMPMGLELAAKTGQALTEEHLQAFEATRVILKGPLTVTMDDASYVHLRGRRFTSANQALRKLFSLYANVRPAVALPGVKVPFPGVNLVVVRENTEDLYTGEENWIDADTAVATRRITRGASQRIARFAFEYAVANRRRLVTAVHKSNVLKQTDGLFLTECRKEAAAHPQIAYAEQLGDSLMTRLVQAPQEYDLLLCPNMMGDLVSDLAAGLVGGLGLCASANLGDDYALFEPCHGSAPDIAGKGIANPASQIGSAVMMLRHLGEQAAAERIETALAAVVSEGDRVTPDLGGNASTLEMAEAVAIRLTRVADR